MERIFISTRGRGLARARVRCAAVFEVETVLPDVAVRCLSVDPLNSDRVYAGTQGAGLLRSDDRGRTWRSAGLPGQTVKAVAASPVQRDVVYAGTRPARLFVSADAGITWAELPGFRHIRGRWLWFSPAEQPFTAYVQGIALSPVDPQRVVTGIESGATVVSTDGGRTWTGHRRGSLRDCHSLAFHPADGGWVYEAGGSGGGAAFSRDGGRTWTKAGEGLDRHYGWAVTADPFDPEVWYVSASPGAFKAHSESAAEAYIFRHDRSGWRRLAGGLPQPLSSMPYALIAGRAGPGWLYAGLSNGEIWHTEDRGDSWERLPISLGSIDRSLVML